MGAEEYREHIRILLEKIDRLDLLERIYKLLEYLYVQYESGI